MSEQTEKNVKRQIFQIQEFVDNAGFVEATISKIETYNINNKNLSSIGLDNLNNEQKIMVFKYVGNHNIKFVKFSNEILKQLIIDISSK